MRLNDRAATTGEREHGRILAGLIPYTGTKRGNGAERDGWDGLYFPDTQCLAGDIYSAMCLAAKATKHLKVGTAVTNPVTRHPSVTASAIATVQVESDGRAVPLGTCKAYRTSSSVDLR